MQKTPKTPKTLKKLTATHGPTNKAGCSREHTTKNDKERDEHMYVDRFDESLKVRKTRH